MRPGCGNLRSYKLFLAAHSVDTILKPASTTNELCSSNCESKTKAKSCHETEMPVSVSLPLLLHIYFHDSLHYFKAFFFFEGWFWMLPSLPTIYLVCHLAVAHTVSISLFSSLSWLLLFSPFAQIPCQSKSQMDWLRLCYSSLRGTLFFWGESSVEHVQGVPSPLPPEHRGPVQLRVLLTCSAAMLLDTACASAVWRYQSKLLTYHPAYTLQRRPGSVQGLSLQLRLACRPL